MGPPREPFAVSRQAHLQRDYAALGARTENITATDDWHATATGAADQTPDEPPRHSAQGSGTRVETGTNTASEPAEQPPWATQTWGRGHSDYARSEGDACRPNTHAEQAAAQDLDLWITRITTEERLALGVSIRWLLSSHSRHLEDGTRTMADVAFGYRTAPQAPPTTMDHLSQWHYVATQLMAHMGTYSPVEMNGLRWLWHQRAALRIRATMQRHNIWAIPGSPGSRGHASGHRRPRSQDVPEPPRQTARHDSPRRHQGPPPGVGSPSGTHGSPLRAFAPRMDQGSPHAPEMKGATPDRHLEATNPDGSRRGSRTPVPAARRIVFHDGADRGRGCSNNPPARQTSSAADPRRRSKRPRTEQTHIPTIPTPTERARQAALHTGPHQATDGAPSLSAAPLPESPAGPVPGGQNAMDAGPRGPAAAQQPEKELRGRTPQSPALPARRDSTSPAHGYRPPDQPGQCATGLPTLAVRQPTHQNAEDASQQRRHDAGNPGADEEMTQASSPQESGGFPPTTASHPMPPQHEPSTGSVPQGHPDAARGHSSPTGTTPDQDRETMPPPPPRPPQRRNTDLFVGEELRAIYDIHANTHLCGLVAAPLETPPGRQPKQALRRGPPAARRIHQQLHAATPGTRHSRDADRGRPRRRVDLVVQLQPAGPGRRVGPVPGLGADAYCAMDGAQAPRQATGAGNGPPHNRGLTPSTSHRTMAWRTTPRTHLVPSSILPELNIHLKMIKMKILKLNGIHHAFIFSVTLVPNLCLGACCRCRARVCRCFCLSP